MARIMRSDDFVEAIKQTARQQKKSFKPERGNTQKGPIIWLNVGADKKACVPGDPKAVVVITLQKQVCTQLFGEDRALWPAYVTGKPMKTVSTEVTKPKAKMQKIVRPCRHEVKKIMGAREQELKAQRPHMPSGGGGFKDISQVWAASM